MQMLVLSYNIQVVQNAWAVVVSDHELTGVEGVVNYPRLLEAAMKSR
jgi:hypothetical protein